MRPLAITIVLTAAMASPASASAPRLTAKQARHAIRAYAVLDHPASVTIHTCRRVAARQIQCPVTEHGLKTSIPDDSQSIVGNLSYTATAVLRHGRVNVAWELF